MKSFVSVVMLVRLAVPALHLNCFFVHCCSSEERRHAMSFLSLQSVGKFWQICLQG